MIQRLIPSGVAAAITGGTMAARPLSPSCPSFAFTLSAPSLAQSAVKADVQQVYYDHYNNSYRVRHYVPKTNLSITAIRRSPSSSVLALVADAAERERGADGRLL